jgi:hypothetical protein
VIRLANVPRAPEARGRLQRLSLEQPAFRSVLSRSRPPAMAGEDIQSFSGAPIHPDLRTRQQSHLSKWLPFDPAQAGLENKAFARNFASIVSNRR